MQINLWLQNFIMRQIAHSQIGQLSFEYGRCGLWARKQQIIASAPNSTERNVNMPKSAWHFLPWLSRLFEKESGECGVDFNHLYVSKIYIAWKDIMGKLLIKMGDKNLISNFKKLKDTLVDKGLVPIICMYHNKMLCHLIRKFIYGTIE